MSQILLEAFNTIPYPTERTEKNGMMDISYTFEDETNHGYRFHFEKRVNYGRNVFVLTLGQKSPNIKMYKRVFGKFHNPLRVIATLIDIVKDNRQKRSDVKGLIIEVPEQAFGAHGRLVDKIIKRELRTELKVQDLELSIEEFEKMGLKGVVATVKPYQFDSVFNGKIMKDILDNRDAKLDAAIAMTPVEDNASLGTVGVSLTYSSQMANLEVNGNTEDGKEIKRLVNEHLSGLGEVSGLGGKYLVRVVRDNISDVQLAIAIKNLVDNLTSLGATVTQNSNVKDSIYKAKMSAAKQSDAARNQGLNAQEQDEDILSHSQKYVAEARQFLDKAIKNELTQSDYDVTDVAFVEFVEPKSGITLYKFRLTVKKNGKVLERQYAYVTATYAGNKVKVDRTSVVNWINSAEDKTNGTDSSQYEQTLEFKKASAESDINSVKITVLGPVPYISIERDVKIMGLVSKACREVFEDVEGLEKDGIRNNGGAQIISFVYGTKYEDLKPYIKSLVLNLKNKGVESELVGNKLDQFTFQDEVKYELLTDERYDIRLRFGTDADAKRAYGILKGAVALQYGNDTMRLYGNTISSLRANVTGRQMDAKVARIIELLGHPSVEKTNLGDNDLNDPSSPLEDARIDITVDEGNKSGTAHIVFQHPSETERSGIQDAIAAIVKKVIPQARRADGSQVDDMFSMVVKGGYLTWNDKIEEIATALNDEHAEAVFHPPEVPDHIKALGDAIKQHNETMTYKTKDGFVFEVNGRKLTFKADVNFNSIMDYVFGWFKSEFDTIDGKRQFVDKTNGDNLTQNFIGVLEKLSIKEAISKKVAEQFESIISKTHREYDLSTTMYERSIGAPAGQISDYREFKGEVVVNDNGTAFAVFTSNTGPFVKSAREQFGSVDFEANGNLNTLKVPLDGNFSIKEFDAGLVGKFLKAHDDNYGVLSTRFYPVKIIKSGKVTYQSARQYASISLNQDLACYLSGLENYDQNSKTSSTVSFEGVKTLSDFYDLCDKLSDYDFEGNYLKAFRFSKYINDAKANGGKLEITKGEKSVKVEIQEDMIFINLTGMSLPEISMPLWKKGETSVFLRTYYLGHKKFNDVLVVLDNFLDKELQGSTSDVKDDTVADKTGVVKQDDIKTFHFEHQKGGFKIVTKSSVEQIKAFVDNTLDLSDNGDGSIFVKLSHFSQTVGTKKRVSAALVGNGFTEGEHVATPGSAAAANRLGVKVDQKPTSINWSTAETALKGQYFKDSNYKVVNMKVDDLISRQATDFRIDAGSNTNRIKGRAERALAHIASGAPMDMPVVDIDAQGNLQVVDGRHRIAVAKEMGLKEIPVFLNDTARKPKLFNDLTIKLAKQGNLPQKTINVKGDDVFITKLSMSGMYNTEERNLSFLMDSNPLYTSIDNQNAEVKRRLLQLVGSSAERIKSAIESWTDGRIKVESVSGSGVKSEPKTDFSFLLNKDISSDAAEPILKYLKKNIKVGTKKYELNSESGVNYLNKILNRLVSLIPNSNDRSFSIGGNINARKAGGLKVVVNDMHRGGYYDGNTHLAVAVQVGGAYTYGINSAVCKFLKEVFANLTNIGDSLPEGRVFDKHGTNFSTVGVAYTGKEYYSKPAFANVKITAKHLVLSDKMNEGIKEDLTGVAPKVNKVEKSILETAMRQMGIYHSAFGYGGGSFTVTMTEGVVDILPVSGNVIALSKLLGVKLGQDLVQDERGGLRFDIA